MKTFRVYTYCAPRETRRSKVSAYTLWASPSWTGCRVYEIEAASGVEAKRIAVDRRLEDERKEVQP